MFLSRSNPDPAPSLLLSFSLLTKPLSPSQLPPLTPKLTTPLSPPLIPLPFSATSSHTQAPTAASDPPLFQLLRALVTAVRVTISLQIPACTFFTDCSQLQQINIWMGVCYQILVPGKIIMRF